jgi:multidrug transporter EmrE-like cation transporter
MSIFPGINRALWRAAAAGRSFLVLSLIVLNLGFVVVSNVSFKFSASSVGWQGLLKWQLVGNIAGFLSVITLTGMLRYMPLSLGYALSAGVGFVLVELVGARAILHEEIGLLQWIGIWITALGVFLIACGKR